MLIKRIFIVLFLLLFCPVHSYAAQQKQEKEKQEFTEINKPEDLIPFADELIAFEGGYRPDQYYPLTLNPQINAGYVLLQRTSYLKQLAEDQALKIEETSFRIQPLFFSKFLDSQREAGKLHIHREEVPLSEDYLKKNKLKVRLITANEVQEMAEVVKSLKAGFGYPPRSEKHQERKITEFMLVPKK